MLTRICIVFSLFLVLAVTAACTSKEPMESTTSETSQPAVSGASVTIQPTEGNQAQGKVELMPMDDGIHFMGTITGLSEGKHGFHVHEKGDCSAPDGSSAGGHFNPDGKPHGGPDSPEHHRGDLGNIEADATGTAQVNIHMPGITLDSGPDSVMGKAIIVHAGEDDLTSQPSGNAGARVGCGVIEPEN